MTNFQVGQAGSIWMQLSSFFFLSAGLFNDLLCIRVSLTMSYVFLVIVGFMGAPRWGQSFEPTGIISVDTIVWAVLNLFVHGNSVWKMFHDERNIELDDDHEALWRFIYRHSGLSKLQFKTKLCPHVNVIDVKPGQELDMKCFYIILDGVVAAEAFNGNTGRKHTFPLLSGQTFPLQHIYACTQSRSIEAMSMQNTFANTWIKPTPMVSTRMYCIDASFLEKLSKNMNAKETWLAVLTTIMAVTATTPYYDDTDVADFVADHRNEYLVEERSPLFDELAPFEEPIALSAGSTKALKQPLSHLLNSYRLSFWVPWPLGIWPQGLRHRLPPPKDPGVKKSMMRKTRILESFVLEALHQDTMNPKDKNLFHMYSAIGEEKDDTDVELYGTFPKEEHRTVENDDLPQDMDAKAESLIASARHRIPSGTAVPSISNLSSDESKKRRSSQVTFAVPPRRYGGDPEGNRMSQVTTANNNGAERENRSHVAVQDGGPDAVPKKKTKTAWFKSFASKK